MVPAGRRAVSVGALAMAAAGTGWAEVPTEWTIEIVARSSLEPTISPYRLPFPSSLSSQPVTLDELGGVAIRSILAGGEAIFYGTPAAGGVIVTVSTDEDPVFSSSIDAYAGLVSVPDASFGGESLTVYDTEGAVAQTFPPGGPLAASGFGLSTLSSDGAICSRVDFGFVGDRVIVDEFAGGVRTQTEIANDFSGEFSFLLTPRMNANRSVVMNTLPESGPSRRIIRFDPDGMGGYDRTTIAETGTTYNSFVNSTAIGNDGGVAFTGRRSADSVWQVVRSDGSADTVIAQGGQMGIVNSNLANFPPVTNANGLVAFRVEDSTTNSTSLFVGDGQTLVRVVAAGDLLDTDLGQIPAGFNFGGDIGTQTINSSVDINDANQIAFAAFLENGTIGVFIATPADQGIDPDLNGDGAVDPKDVDALLSGVFDFDGTGAFDFLDVILWLEAAAAAI